MQISCDLIGKRVRLQNGAVAKVLLVKKTCLFYIVRLAFAPGNTRAIVYRRNGEALFNQKDNIVMEDLYPVSGGGKAECLTFEEYTLLSGGGCGGTLQYGLQQGINSLEEDRVHDGKTLLRDLRK